MIRKLGSATPLPSRDQRLNQRADVHVEQIGRREVDPHLPSRQQMDRGDLALGFVNRRKLAGIVTERPAQRVGGRDALRQELESWTKEVRLDWKIPVRSLHPMVRTQGPHRLGEAPTSMRIADI